LKTAVVTFPGSNCDQDAVHVVRDLLRRDVEPVWHEQDRLPERTSLVVLPGGFSYGDALRSGAIARFSPIMAEVRRHAEAGGLVLGICNGFQVLVESGLLPGAMLQNANQKFVCRVTTLRVERTDTAFTGRYRGGQTLRIPVAHHEGRYHASDEVLDALERNGQIVFRYVDNPNGSVRDIAGIVNGRRNVLGMMPHPERAAEEVLGSADGRALFESVFDALSRGAVG
jgi:phosphoribosylformylglycinamidine synthase